ncbi:bifunctional adenosylcobinamide kinase/adenosylcobinamide-phosphate guanylyltransferase [Salipaludibacillus sp. CUR1]|uniref:bifunctional adenosylcobinamide kinase/adenosylcobinamide-phosphate guanylyltransferase n=1 Tax=Salipaludibacillus sp. CUR1 TaxID=2820003 RepID=UPI001E384B20|nr:bifunctional adenosylcobinamide kinase/adenosylcobinamide-phosphate guanylyltransferase [Salipaludibacillus sp. CUR1]MCE7791609.1 bifunctional adenosylcobinamide kinase/adenosylcobinamide-phosphate guanylyltransferase [Salipaludibacillus sp. CUR1]
MIWFISGGARSGKSTYAENKAAELYEEAERKNGAVNLIYAATARASDEEMAERIRRHRAGRSEIWQTIEVPWDLRQLVEAGGKGDVLLVDCLTVWLNNMLFNKKETRTSKLIDIMSDFIQSAKEKEQQLLFVSNDVNEDLPSSNRYIADYTYKLEAVHRFIVSQADRAVQVNAGLPLHWKGEAG